MFLFMYETKSGKMSDLRTRDGDGVLGVVAGRDNSLRTLGYALLPGQSWDTQRAGQRVSDV